jgi:acyl carrier protein
MTETATRETIRASIRAKIRELAASLGNADLGDLNDDDIIPATGLLDSAAILELIVWYENAHGLTIKQEEINIDNLGSIGAMVEFALARRPG